MPHFSPKRGLGPRAIRRPEPSSINTTNSVDFELQQDAKLDLELSGLPSPPPSPPKERSTSTSIETSDTTKQRASNTYQNLVPFVLPFRPRVTSPDASPTEVESDDSGSEYQPSISDGSVQEDFLGVPMGVDGCYEIDLVSFTRKQRRPSLETIVLTPPNSESESESELDEADPINTRRKSTAKDVHIRASFDSGYHGSEEAHCKGVRAYDQSATPPDNMSFDSASESDDGSSDFHEEGVECYSDRGTETYKFPNYLKVKRIDFGVDGTAEGSDDLSEEDPYGLVKTIKTRKECTLAHGIGKSNIVDNYSRKRKRSHSGSSSLDPQTPTKKRGRGSSNECDDGYVLLGKKRKFD